MFKQGGRVVFMLGFFSHFILFLSLNVQGLNP